MKTNLIHAAKWALSNFECGECKTGVVQVHQVIKRGGIVTTTVSGCLDCGHEYGLHQASKLNKYTRDDITWA
jgi:hypothetical protein